MHLVIELRTTRPCLERRDVRPDEGATGRSPHRFLTAKWRLDSHMVPVTDAGARALTQGVPADWKPRASTRSATMSRRGVPSSEAGREGWDGYLACRAPRSGQCHLGR